MTALVISYSRIDRPQVRAVVQLLRTAFPSVDKAVYWDGDLEPGDDWFEEIRQHIEATHQLFVFWCHHSAQSHQVRREFMHAIGCNKRVIPVLLDDTPLSDELAPIHGIDLRDAISHGRTAAPPGSAPPSYAPPSYAPPSFSPKSMGYLLLSLLLWVLILGAGWLLFQWLSWLSLSRILLLLAAGLIVTGLGIALYRYLKSARPRRKARQERDLEVRLSDRLIRESERLRVIKQFEGYLSR